jgi:hypothetical protein
VPVLESHWWPQSEMGVWRLDTLGPVIGGDQHRPQVWDNRYEWLRVSELPGTRLQVHTWGVLLKRRKTYPASYGRSRDIVAADGQVLMTVRLAARDKSMPFGGMNWEERRAHWRGISALDYEKEKIRRRRWMGMSREVLTHTESGRQFRWIGGPQRSSIEPSESRLKGGSLVSPPRPWGAPGPRLVETSAEDVILEPSGHHDNHLADTTVRLSGQRWFRFPVWGTSSRNAVMSAVDETNTSMLTFRKVEHGGEVVVSPACSVTAEILCVVAVTAPLLQSYWRHASVSTSVG